MSFSIPFTNVPLLHRITLLIRSTSRHSFLLPLLGSFGESRALCVRAKGAFIRKRLLLLALLLKCLGPSVALGQATPDVEQGFKPYGSYEGGDIDTVNLNNGNLTLHIPILSYPQLGKVKLDFALVYNAQPWRQTLVLEGTSNPTYTEQFGNAPCVTGGVYLTSNLAWCGTVQLFNNGPQSPPATPVNQLGGKMPEQPPPGNGSTATWFLSTAYDPFGGTHQFVPTTSAMNSYMSLDATGMQLALGGVITSDGVIHGDGAEADKFGNVVSGNPTNGWTDSTGRSIPAPQSVSVASCPSGTTTATSWTVPAYASVGNGTATYISCFTVISVSSSFPFSNEPNVYPRFINGSGSTSVLTAFILPNGEQWTFSYDGQGDLQRLTFPTGGYITYTWAPLGSCNNSELETYSMSITSRTLNPGNGEPSATWNYNISNAQSTVVDPMGNATVHTFSAPGGCSFFETNTAYYQGAVSSSNLIKVVSTQYSGGTNPNDNDATAMNVVPTSVTTTTASGQQSTSIKTYDSGISVWDQTWDRAEAPVYYNLIYGSLLSTADYDFGIPKTGAPTRTTVTNWLWQSNPAYLNAGLMSLPASRQILNSSGQQASYTTYTYDETSYSPGGVLGQPTTTVNYLGTDPGPTTHTGWLANGEKSYVIDADGHVNSNGHTVDYGYSECDNSLVTSTVNALNQKTSATYDCNSGLVTSITDPNMQTTSYTYDELSRITGAVAPAIALPGGQIGSPTTTFVYNDAAKTATETVTASPDPTQTTEVVFDGLGREIHRYVTDVPLADTTDTNYDLLGRVGSVSNPYRSTSDSTYGTTSYAYDALGRKVIQTQPDGSTLQWCYDGVGGVAGQTICTSNLSSVTNASWVDSTDEAGRHSQHVTDSFGRLRAVMEPNPTTNTPALQTNYTYDVLNNLLSVNQIGVSSETPRARIFSYDSLSRLLTSQNPETGSISYQYDPNGNALSKTDASGVVMSYAYDGLNRLTSKTSSDGTVADTYYYDNTGLGPNEIGRLSVANHNSVSSTGFYYDALGHVSSTSYATPGSGGWQGGMSVAYDLAGNPAIITYPDGRQVTQTFDVAGRLATATSGGVSYISGGSGAGISYWSSGAESAYTLGNGLTAVNEINNRLQPCHTMVSTPMLTAIANAGNLLDRESYYHGSATANCGSEAGNNGNIFSIIDNRNTGWSQAFTYDSLNRLTTALRLDNGYSHNYSYDSFGNVTLQDNLHTNPTWAIDPATNELLRNPTGGALDQYGHPSNDFTYNKSGNMVSSGPAGHTYTYNALGQIMTVDGGASSYYYNGSDERTFKQTGSNWTSYIYLNGQPMAEQSSSGIWTDYIYANGQKIAKVVSQLPVLDLHGVRNSSDYQCGLQGALSGMSSGAAGTVIATGDRLVVDMQQNVVTDGGVALIFTNGAGTGSLVDSTSGQGFFSNGFTDGLWHHMAGSLASYVGLTVSYALAGIHQTAAFSTFDLYIANLAIVHANGSITPIGVASTGTTVAGFTGSNCAGSGFSAGMVTTPVTDPTMATNYYVDDHLGTAQMETDGAGWPIWEAQFTPFGLELDTSYTPMHYKFTGKERDTESGLDYFGARYYASGMGRWMSPDWSAKAEPVPYAKLDNPQSLNLYAYVNNNPLRAADLDGHDDYDGKVHVTPNADGTKTAVQGTQTTATSQTKDASGNVTSTTTTTTKSLTTVTLDAHGDVSGASNTTTVSSQTVDSKGSVTGSTSSTSTSSLDEHSTQVSNIQSDAKGLMQMNVTDLVPKTFAPKILDHFHITGQDVLDGIKAFGQGARDGGYACAKTGQDCVWNRP